MWKNFKIQQSPKLSQLRRSRETLQKLLVVETVNERVSARNKNSNANSSNRSTGIKNVSYDPCRCRYLINVRRSKQSFSERSKSLQEAIRIKDRVLEFYDNFNRLPRQNEI